MGSPVPTFTLRGWHRIAAAAQPTPAMTRTRTDTPTGEHPTTNHRRP